MSDTAEVEMQEAKASNPRAVTGVVSERQHGKKHHSEGRAPRQTPGVRQVRS